MRDRAWRKSELWLTLVPYLWLLLFFLIPTLIVYAFSFKPSELYGSIGTGWTLENLRQLYSSSNMILIQRTLLLSSIVTIISLILAIPVGYGIARSKAKMQQIFLLLIILPFWSSFIVRVFAWKTLLHPEGLLRQFLLWLHMIQPDTILLYNAWSVVLVMVYSFVPFAVFPIYSASQKFDEHLFEAAMDLGMSRTQAFFKVYLPCISTGIMMAMLLVFIPALGAYVIPDVVGGPQNEMIGNRIVHNAFIDRNIPMASTLSAFLSLAILIPMAVIAINQSRSGKSHAVKGGR